MKKCSYHRRGDVTARDEPQPDGSTKRLETCARCGCRRYVIIDFYKRTWGRWSTWMSPLRADKAKLEKVR